MITVDKVICFVLLYLAKVRLDLCGHIYTLSFMLSMTDLLALKLISFAASLTCLLKTPVLLTISDGSLREYSADVAGGTGKLITHKCIQTLSVLLFILLQKNHLAILKISVELFIFF